MRPYYVKLHGLYFHLHDMAPLRELKHKHAGFQTCDYKYE